MDGFCMEELELKGYYPGLIGTITTTHAVYYNLNWGFDSRFEIDVSRDLSEFLENFDPNRDGLWAATSADSFIGSVAVDGFCGPAESARLRWFIVKDTHQGKGIGSKLMDKAIQHARSKGYKSLYLWTFEGLRHARRLYERNGFNLIEEDESNCWGPKITEQKFELIL